VAQVPNKKWAAIIAFLVIGSVAVSIAAFALNNGQNKPPPTNKQDSDGDGMSDEFETTISHTDPHVYNGRYALLVSTGNETSTIDKMYSFLTNEQKFQPQDIKKLASTNATEANFRQALSELSHKVSGNDIFYAILDGHGGKSGEVGFFVFNDGKGNNQNVNPVMTYKSMNTLFNPIKSKATVITVSACDAVTALEPLKEGPSPRVVMTMPANWFFATSKNYSLGAPSLQYDSVKPKDYDIDGNGYVSVKESFETQMRSMQRFLSENPERASTYGMIDPHNVSKDTYLGEFSVSD
jgi:hypothetical protein